MGLSSKKTKASSEESTQQSESSSSKTNTNTNELRSPQKLGYSDANMSFVYNPSTQTYETKLSEPQQSYKNLQNSLAMSNLSAMNENLSGGLGSDNPFIRSIMDNMNTISDAEISKNTTKLNNMNASSGNYGSSYDATMQAALAQNAGSLKASNFLDALMQGNSIINQNTQMRSGVQGLYTDNVQPILNPSLATPYADLSTSGSSQSLTDAIGNLTKHTKGSSTSTTSDSLGGNAIGLVEAISKLKGK